MRDDKMPMQADGGGRPADAPEAPQGHEGAGESGGGAYKETHVQDGDNRERMRPVETDASRRIDLLKATPRSP